jgi:hypothetical protein
MGEHEGFTVESDGTDIFVRRQGVTIAKRGRPGTPQAGKWITMKVGWQVSGSGDELTITHDGVQVH